MCHRWNASLVRTTFFCRGNVLAGVGQILCELRYDFAAGFSERVRMRSGNCYTLPIICVDAFANDHKADSPLINV